MFSNKNKTNDKAPDFFLYASIDQTTKSNETNSENSSAMTQTDDVPSI